MEVKKRMAGAVISGVITFGITWAAFILGLGLPLFYALPGAVLVGVFSWGIIAWLVRLPGDVGARIERLLTIAATAFGLLFLSINNTVYHPDVIAACRDLSAKYPSFEANVLVIYGEAQKPAFRLLPPVRLEVVNRGRAEARNLWVHIEVEDPLILSRLAIWDEEGNPIFQVFSLRIREEDYRAVTLTQEERKALRPGEALDIYLRLASGEPPPIEAGLEIRTDSEGQEEGVFRFKIRWIQGGDVQCEVQS